MNPDTKALAVERLRLLADGCDVPGLDHLPIVSRANAKEFAADIRTVLTALTQPPPVSEIRERVARIIDPSSWRVFDGYLADLKRKYGDKRAGYDSAAFQDKKSLALADKILALLPQPPADHGPTKGEALEDWIEKSFSGWGAALRKEDDPPIPGEPFMSMDIAKGLVREAIDRFAHQPPGSDGEWRGIESAPRNGSGFHQIVLAHFHEHIDEDGNLTGEVSLSWAHVVYWTHSGWMMNTAGWASIHGNASFPVGSNATHWMPLPTPPSPSTVADGGEEGT